MKHDEDALETGYCDAIISSLAELNENAIIPEKALADIFSCSTITIKRAVDRGELPQPIRMFAKPSWTAGNILRHVNTRLEEAQREAEEERKRLAQYD